MNKIYNLLHQLGISSNYTGFYPTADAINLCIQQQDRLVLVTKRLYPEIAKRHGTNWKNIEHHIRTISKLAWTRNRPLLEHVAEIPLQRPPSASSFLAVLSFHLLHNSNTD